MSNNRRILAAILCAVAPVATCIAQYPNYDVVASNPTSGSYPGDTYAVDLNNDGVPDLIESKVVGDNGVQLPDFAVFIANGDGTFKGQVLYQYPAGFQDGFPPPPFGPMAFGDFNGDGNIDMAMVSGDNAITVYLGKGDGTFVNPWHSWILSIPSDQYFAEGYPNIFDIVAADFNHDRKEDLAVVGVGASTNVVYILPGQGNGLFSTDVPILTVPGAGNSSNSGVHQLVVGDFDGDTNADIVAMASVATSSGNSGIVTVHVLYGDGNFGFQDTTPIPLQGEAYMHVGNLNSDGKSDMYILGAGGLKTYYGLANRTFAAYTQSSIWGGAFSTAAVANFNDDSRNDIVGMAGDYTGSFLIFYLATGTLGKFIYQTWNAPQAQSIPVVGDFNRDGKPDWAYIGRNASGYSNAYTGLNSTEGQLWSDCDYPSTARGIMACSPTVNSSSTVNFNATAHSFGDLRKIELWVDGNKLGEQYHTWEGNAFFNFSSTMGPGTHAGTYFAVDMDRTLQQYNFNFTVPSSCAAPGSPGVQICAPTNASTTSPGPVLVQASANITGTLARMEIWVDSVKKYTETTSTSLSASITVSPGQHWFTVFAVNTDGSVWQQATSAMVP